MSTATIKIAIEAQTAMLQKGFAEAKGAINGLSSSMSGSFASGMLKANAVMAAVAAAAGLVKAGFENIMNAVSQLDAIGDAADNLGMNADALTVLGYAATQAGVSQDGLNQALMKMQNVISEAATGSESAAAALGELGLSAETLRSMGTDEAFAAIAEQMQQVGNQTDRTRLMMDIFGKSGARLNGLVAGGAEGLNAYGKEAEGLGLILGEARAKVDQANQSLDRMKAAWSALWQQIATLVAPAITAVASALANVVGWFNKAMGRSAGVEAPFKAYETSAKKAAITIDETMKSTEKSAAKSAEKIKESWRDIPKPQDWKTAGIGAATRGTAAGFSAVQEANRARQDDERRHRDMISWLAKIYQAQQESAIRVQAVSI